MRKSDDMTPLRLYEALREDYAVFGFDNDGFYITGATGLLDRYDSEIEKHAASLAAIVREFEPSTEPQTLDSAIALIDRAEQILRDVNGESHGGDGESGSR